MAEPAVRRLALVITSQKQISSRVRIAMLRLLDEVVKEAEAGAKRRRQLVELTQLSEDLPGGYR